MLTKKLLKYFVKYQQTKKCRYSKNCNSLAKINIGAEHGRSVEEVGRGIEPSRSGHR